MPLLGRGRPMRDRGRARRSAHGLRSDRRHCVGLEEPEHLTAGTGPGRVRVGARRVATRPGVTASVENPLFRGPGAVGRRRYRPCVGHAALRSPRDGAGLERDVRPSLRHGLIAVDGRHGPVVVPMEDDGRHLHARRRCSAGRAPRRIVENAVAIDPRRSAGQTGMNTDRRVKVRIGESHHGRRGAPQERPAT